MAEMNQAATNQKLSYWSTWVAALVFFGAFYALLVPFPLYLAACGLRDWQIAAILGALGIASLIGRPIAGICVDSWGAQRVLLFGTVSLAGGAALVPLATSPTLLFSLRVLQAIGYVAFTTAATARVLELADPKRRGAAIAFFGIAVNLAVSVTPLLTSFALEWLSLAEVFLLAGALAGAAGVLSSVGAFGGEPSHKAIGARFKWTMPQSVRAAMLSASLLGIGFGVFLQFLPIVLEERTLTSVGGAYGVYGAAIIATRLISARSQNRVDRRPILAVGFLVCGCGLALLAIATSSLQVFLAAACVAVGSGVVHPGLIATHVEQMAETERGRAVANFYLAFDAGIGLGTWLLMPVFNSFGAPGLFGAAAALTMIGATVVWWIPIICTSPATQH